MIKNECNRPEGNIKKILFQSRKEAEQVLNAMNNLVIDYGQASLADYYDICGYTNSLMDYKYGWTSVERAEIWRIGYEYAILFPEHILLSCDSKPKTETDSPLVKDDAPIILTISQVDLLSKEYIKQEYIDQIGKVACVCGVYKTIRSVSVTEQYVIVELD